MSRVYCLLFVLAAWLTPCAPAAAHHVLGRPSYALNEDSNTPPALQVETSVGRWEIDYMVFPAFPRPQEPGRVNLYIAAMDDGQLFKGEVTFTVRDDSWAARLGLDDNEEVLGVQVLDDAVFRQGFVFREAGTYTITANFEADGEPYAIAFPLRVGAPPPWGPLGIAVALILAVLAAISLAQRRRALTGKIRRAKKDRE